MVHDVASQGFGAEAAVYERARPSYPADAVDWMLAGMEAPRAGRTVDLAAGTGKLTRLLNDRVTRVVAVEPVAGMRGVLCARGHKGPVLAAAAEQLPFADASLDLVTVAQAFHWFEHDRAIEELRRALRVRGRLAMIWNARDRSTAWVDAVWSIMDRVEKRAPWRDHENWRDRAFTNMPGFSELTVAEFRHEQRATPDDVVARIASVSHVAVLGDDERRAVLDEVRSILSDHPATKGQAEVAIPYRADAMWCERVE